MTELKKRLSAAAAMVPPTSVVCDVGCDHAYLPIALVERGVAKCAIAMDLRESPLSIAKANVKQAGLSDRIELRLSDGLAALAPGEADVITICGMGGMLMVAILQRGLPQLLAAKELILEPHSDVAAVRRWLGQQGGCIVDEDLVCEDGKYYPVIRARVGASIPEQAAGGQETSEPVVEESAASGAEAAVDDALAERFGGCLLQKRHPVLRAFLEKEEARLAAILSRLPLSSTVRRREVDEELSLVREALRWFSMDTLE